MLTCCLHLGQKKYGNVHMKRHSSLPKFACTPVSCSCLPVLWMLRFSMMQPGVRPGLLWGSPRDPAKFDHIWNDCAGKLACWFAKPAFQPTQLDTFTPLFAGGRMCDDWRRRRTQVVNVTQSCAKLPVSSKALCCAGFHSYLPMCVQI